MAKLKTATVEAKLREERGNIAAVGRALGVSRRAVHKIVTKSKRLKVVCDECREAMKDDAEASLHKEVLAGGAWAVCCHLKTQAKDRGYTERQELTGPGGDAVAFRIHEASDEFDPDTA